MFIDYLKKLGTCVGADRNIKVYIESIYTGYQIKFDLKGIQIEDTAKKEIINWDDFILDINTVTLKEQLLYSNGKDLNKYAFSEKEHVIWSEDEDGDEDDYSEEEIELKRKCHFIFETRMLVLETFFRDLNKDDLEYNKWLDYSLYKHLVIYYNCRAKRSISNNSKINNLKLICSKFKGLYVSVPSFTSVNFDEEDKIISTTFPQIEFNIEQIDLKSTINFDVVPINILPIQFINQLNLEKTLSVYTLSNLSNDLAEFFGESKIDIKNYYGYEFLKQASYNNLFLFNYYWFTDYLYSKYVLNLNTDTLNEAKFMLLCIIDKYDGKSCIGVSYIKPYNIKSLMTTLKDKDYTQKEIKYITDNIKIANTNMRSVLGNFWNKHKEG